MTKIDRQESEELDIQLRRTTFQEVSKGFTAEQAVLESMRCLHCPSAPCTKGCPVNVKIPDFIAQIKSGNGFEAARIIKLTNNLPAVCGRVCPQERQCESLCVLGKRGAPVSIGRLERFAADSLLAETGVKLDCFNNNVGIEDREQGGFDDIRMGESTRSHVKLSGIISNEFDAFRQCVKEKDEWKDQRGVKNVCSDKPKQVAVIGSGPAGLTCAGDLAQAGVKVTIFEAFHRAGGVLVYGIPEFRLPKQLVQAEIDELKALGVRIELNTVIGKTITLRQLRQEFDAVFIGTGAGLPQFMNIPGENLLGVCSANEYLTRINLMKAYEFDSATPVQRAKNVVVVGAGNVAMDAARTALRLGANVRIIYRRAREQMPARREEIRHAEEEGVVFELLTNPIAIVGENGKVVACTCVRMSLGELDQSGRSRPEPIAGSEFMIECDMVIVALGTSPNPLLKNSCSELITTHQGTIEVNESTLQTSIEKVYAGGDAVTGAATVILAMGAGKKAAECILESLRV